MYVRNSFVRNPRHVRVVESVSKTSRQERHGRKGVSSPAQPDVPLPQKKIFTSTLRAHALLALRPSLLAPTSVLLTQQ